MVIDEPRKSERLQFHVYRRAVQYAQHHRFDKLSGQSRNTEIDLAAGQREADAAVLGQPAFGDVQVGHDFDPRGHRQGQVFGRRRHFIQRAVHAVTNLEFVLERLEVDVAGAVLHCLIKDQIYKLDDGRCVGKVLQVRHPVARSRLRHFPGDFGVGPQFLEDVADAFTFLAV